MKTLIYISILTALFLTSCFDYNQDSYEEHYAVEAYLVADRQLPNILLSTTVPADEIYDIENSAVYNAQVEVRLLTSGPFSDVEQTFNYSVTESGKYNSIDQHKVLPLRTYELNITFPNSVEEISAYTVIPDTFHIKKGVLDSVEYQSDEKFEITISESSYPGRQNIFIFNAISLSPKAENLTPMFRGFYENDGNNADDLEVYANSSSGIYNEGNFKLNPDGSFTIDYPWVGFPFYGENLLVANTIDDNIYDFVRSQSVQLGGSTISPGEIQNVIYNIEGGVGIFGSLASDTTSTIIQQPETNQR